MLRGLFVQTSDFMCKTDFLRKAIIYVVIRIGKSQSRCPALCRHGKLNLCLPRGEPP
jgi:hypothetical protein